MLRIALAKYAAVLLAGITIGATVNGWRLSGQIAQLQADHTQQILDITRAATDAVTEARELQRTAISQLSELDTRYTQELADAQAEADELRRAVAAGERKLRIQATCPASNDGSMPSTGTAAGVDDAAGTRLTDAAERDYYRLRSRIETITAQVNGLQSYIRSACL